MKEIKSYRDLDEYVYEQLECGNVIIGDRLEVELDFKAYNDIKSYVEKDCAVGLRYSYDLSELYVRGVYIKLVEVAGSKWKDLLSLEDKNISVDIQEQLNEQFAKYKENELIKRGSKIVIGTGGINMNKPKYVVLGDAGAELYNTLTPLKSKSYEIKKND